MLRCIFRIHKHTQNVAGWSTQIKKTGDNNGYFLNSLFNSSSSSSVYSFFFLFFIDAVVFSVLCSILIVLCVCVFFSFYFPMHCILFFYFLKITHITSDILYIYFIHHFDIEDFNVIFPLFSLFHSRPPLLPFCRHAFHLAEVWVIGITYSETAKARRRERKQVK